MTADIRHGEQARRILRGNDRGGYCVPTARLYPFQWNWDSAFVAMGWATFDEARAWQEISSLLRGQWADGMIPQIVFHAHAAEDAAAFGHESEPFTQIAFGLVGNERAALVDDFTAIRQQAGDGPQCAGLAGPVGADQRNDLASLDIEIDAADCADRAIENIQLAQPQHAASLPR